MSHARALLATLILLLFSLPGLAKETAAGTQDPVPIDGLRFEGLNGYVHAVIEWNGSLVVGGEFTQAGDVPALHIARWDGAAWNALGAGIATDVLALAVYNGDLIAGAGGVPNDPHVFRWNGTSWIELGSRPNGDVFALSVYQGELIAGGAFDKVGQDNNARRVARWNGTTWNSLGTGVNSDVYALTEFSNTLVVGGRFSSAGGTSASRIASWDGVAWSPLGLGFSDQVNALVVHDSTLLAGGRFGKSGTITLNRVGRWDGNAWLPLGSGTSGEVFALKSFAGELIAGGSFSTAGGVPASRIASWDGVTWSALGTGTDEQVWALLPWGANLIAGGRFSQAGGVAANHIAVWNGGSWFPVAPIGACCDPFAACTITSEDLCAAQGGAFLGNATACDPDPCPAVAGACCLTGGSCQVATRQECAVLCGVFFGYSTVCSPNPCSGQGACCSPDGHCNYRSPLQCTTERGEFLGPNVPCIPNPCSSVPVTQVTLRLFDQNSVLIPAGQFCVGGVYVAQGATISLRAGRRYLNIYPGINGQSQTTSLARFDSLIVSGAPQQTIDFVWKLADLGGDLVDQSGIRIPASQWQVAGLPLLSAGESLRLPVTEDPATPELSGQYAAGYPVSLFPGLNGLAQTTLLTRTNLVELLPGSAPQAQTWKCGEGAFQIVDDHEAEIPGARYLFSNNIGGGFTGDPVLLAASEDPSSPPIGGLLAAGYQIGLQPSPSEPTQYVTLEVNEDASITPSLVSVNGRLVGVRLNLPPAGGATYVVRPDGSGDFATVAAAVAAASPADTIRVMDGVYSWPAQTGSVIDFAGKDVVLISQNGPAATVFDFSGGAGQVRFSGGESYRAVLDGFTLRNGSQAGENNGVLRISGASPTIRDCVVSGNQTTDDRAAAIMILAGGSPRFLYCTVAGNECKKDRGSLYLRANSSARLDHCVLWGNCDDHGAERDYYVETGTLWFNTSVVNNNGIHGQGQVLFEYGNIFADPLYCAPTACGSAPTSSGLYSVRAGSPCLLSDGFRLIGALGEGCGNAAVWDGGGDGVHWNNAANWVGNVLPSEESYVQITLPGSYTVLLDVYARVRHLELGTGPGGPGLRLQAAELVVDRGGVNRGALTVSEGSRLRLEGTGDPSEFFLNQGTLTLEGGEVSGNNRIQNDGTVRKTTVSDGLLTTDLSTGSGGTLLAEAGVLHLTGALSHAGTLVLSAGATLDLGSGPNVAVCESSSSVALQGGWIGGSRTLSMLNDVACTATVPASNELALPIYLGPAAHLQLTTGTLDVSRQLESHGWMELQPSTTLSLSMGNPAEKLLIMEGGRLSLSGSQVVGPGEISNLGLVDCQAGSPSQVISRLTNRRQLSPPLRGWVHVPAGELTVHHLENFGLISIDPAAVLAVTDSLENRSLGQMDGAGTMDILGGVFRNEGKIRPGGDGATAIFRVEGVVEQSPVGTIEIEIGQRVAGTEFDQLLCRGMHNGWLDVRLINGFVPQLGDSFLVVMIQGGVLQEPPILRIGGLDCVSGLGGLGTYLEEFIGPGGISLLAVTNPGTNQGPAAVDDGGSTNWLTPLPLAVLDNDTDPDFGDILRIARLELAGTRGQAFTLPGDSLILYSPPVSYSGLDTLRYIATDCRGLNDTAQVVVAVSCPPGIVLRVPAEYQTIQSALDVAVSTDTIQIAPGIYDGAGNVDLTFRGKNLVLRSEAGPGFTLLDCGGNSSGILFESGESFLSVVQGLTIRNAGQGSASGGAIRVNGASPTLVNCVLHGNFAAQGAAVAVEQGSVQILNCTLAGNRASGLGGALYGGDASLIHVERSVLWDNCAPGPGNDFWTAGSITFSCCVVDSALDHAASRTYLSSNSFSAPLFCQEVDCSSSPQSEGQYHVDASSWCVATNNPCEQTIGALDWQCTNYSGLAIEGRGIPAELTLGHPVPNPAFNRVRLSFGLPRAGRVQLRLYDVSGRVVREATIDDAPAGYLHMGWELEAENNRGRLSSGIYFLQLKWERLNRVVPLVIVR